MVVQKEADQNRVEVEEVDISRVEAEEEDLNQVEAEEVVLQEEDLVVDQELDKVVDHKEVHQEVVVKARLGLKTLI